ncbi:MAG: hypothetical protein HKN47_20695 [Pirellulaceae bacterium]|nr:hypothetical protein [Pirellulaceae bacterium]
MKRRNAVACDEAMLINTAGDRPIDPLNTRVLDRHLENLHLFKLGLRNSLGVDLRNDEHTCAGDDRESKPVLFNYLSEVLPLLESQVRRLEASQQRIYAKMADAALTSFWEIYYRFQPLIHHHADRSGVEVDDLGNILGRTILLYDKKLGFKFFTYLEKTLRESIKNLRGREYAREFHLPLSAGRLMPQLLWILDQETLRLQRRLAPAESDRLVIDFLQSHRAKFSPPTMAQIAQAVRSQRRTVSLDLSPHACESSPGCQPRFASSPSDEVEARDEYEHMLRRVHDAIVRAGFDAREQAILLQRLDLTYDQDLFAQLERERTAGSLRNRRSQLLVRFFAALHADQAPHFGRFLHADPLASKPMLLRVIGDVAQQCGVSVQFVNQSVMNSMSLSDSVYRISISERGRLESFLQVANDHPRDRVSISGHLYNKLKAALIDQDRQKFTCVFARFSD